MAWPRLACVAGHATQDAKFGFGGKKRYAKENTRESLDAGPGPRLGKAARGAAGKKGKKSRPGAATRKRLAGKAKSRK